MCLCMNANHRRHRGEGCGVFTTKAQRTRREHKGVRAERTVQPGGCFSLLESDVELAAAGSLLAYAFLAGATAPGQISAEALHARLLEVSPGYAARRGTARAAT